MILYLDTSSLIKIYIREDGSEDVESLAGQASVVATSVIAYPEARSALARLLREGTLEAEQYQLLIESLDEDLDRFLLLGVTEDVWRHAGELAETHGLRGFDSLHLASALRLRSLADGQLVRFSSYDQRLNKAAKEVFEG